MKLSCSARPAARAAYIQRWHCSAAVRPGTATARAAGTDDILHPCRTAERVAAARKAGMTWEWGRRAAAGKSRRREPLERGTRRWPSGRNHLSGAAVNRAGRESVMRHGSRGRGVERCRAERYGSERVTDWRETLDGRTWIGERRIGERRIGERRIGERWIGERRIGERRIEGTRLGRGHGSQGEERPCQGATQRDFEAPITAEKKRHPSPRRKRGQWSLMMSYAIAFCLSLSFTCVEIGSLGSWYTYPEEKWPFLPFFFISTPRPQMFLKHFLSSKWSVGCQRHRIVF